GSKSPYQATPVTLPPGRARLVMRPNRTGSHPESMTIGIVVVSCFSAITKEYGTAISTSGRRDTSSRARIGSWSNRSAVDTQSKASVWPSIQPSFAKRSDQKAAAVGHSAIASEASPQTDEVYQHNMS